jgi:hypothetical protein
VGTALAVCAVLAVAAGGWGWSMWRHPWRRCFHCGGSGMHRGALGVAGRCRCCGGKKAHVRLDVRMLTPGRAERLRKGDTGRYG